ncbi:hypothetical protein B0A49_13612, partial [Cryomyces minteri]
SYRANSWTRLHSDAILAKRLELAGCLTTSSHIGKAQVTRYERILPPMEARNVSMIVSKMAAHTPPRLVPMLDHVDAEKIG